jgi:hypothetical protein
MQRTTMVNHALTVPYSSPSSSLRFVLALLHGFFWRNQIRALLLRNGHFVLVVKSKKNLACSVPTPPLLLFSLFQPLSRMHSHSILSPFLSRLFPPSLRLILLSLTCTSPLTCAHLLALVQVSGLVDAAPPYDAAPPVAAFCLAASSLLYLVASRFS